MNWQLASGTYTWPECAALEVNGWRIPTLKELESLVDYTRINPPIDPVLFPDTPPDLYWTSTDDATNPGQFRWCVDFMTGSAVKDQPAVKHHVRLCQGSMQQSVFTQQGDVVVDTTHNLMWKRDWERRVPTDPEPGQEDRRNCFTLAQGQERAAVDGSLSFTNWRVPTIRELRSLIDESHLRPRGDGYSCAMNDAFPPTPYQAWFWSCTPALDIYHNEQTWAVAFDIGVDVGNPPNYSQYVRLVRDTGAVVPGYTEAQVRSWFANVNFCPHDSGVAYWMLESSGGPKAFYGTVRDVTVKTCNDLISKL